MINKQKIKQIFWSGVLSTILFALILLWYLLSGDASFMTGMSWTFYIFACIGHAFTLSLIISIISALLPRRLGNIVQPLLVWSIMSLLVLNEKVYEQYRFHINGIVIDMLKGPGANQIFVFDTALVVKVILIALAMLVVCIVLQLVAIRMGKNIMFKKKYLFLPLSALLMLVSAHLLHAYAIALGKSATVKSAQKLPYFFPLTANTLIVEGLGLTTWEEFEKRTFDTSNSGEICYPKNEIAIDTTATKQMNIVIIAIDSWSTRSLSQETMPNVYRYATSHEWYTNHLSSNNGTRGGIFGLFYGITALYWNDFDMAGYSPLLLERLKQLGYSVQTYTGATLASPPFSRTVFRNFKDINLSMPGKTAYDRDSMLTATFRKDLEKHAADKKPFFSFLFYDLPHSFEPAKHIQPFQPAWEYVDYTKLSNSTDPKPFWNLYRNCVFAVDKLIGTVYADLEKYGFQDNTIVIMLGDHGQEFNENHNNSWGHGIAGNYSRMQLNVPLIVSIPGKPAAKYNYRTTHYDIAPTLLHDYLGVNNPISDYSMGKTLNDSTSRGWHIAGDFLEIVFVTPDNIVIQKTPSGSLEVSDDRMKPTNKTYSQEELQATLKKMNMFYK